MYLFGVVSVQCWRYGVRKHLGYFVVWMHTCTDTFHMGYIPNGAHFLILCFVEASKRMASS